MDKKEFYAEIATVLELEPGSIKGNETLEELEGWDSMAVLGFIAMLDSRLGLIVPASSIAASRTVEDLVNLCQGKVTE